MTRQSQADWFEGFMARRKQRAVGARAARKKTVPIMEDTTGDDPAPVITEPIQVPHTTPEIPEVKQQGPCIYVEPVQEYLQKYESPEPESQEAREERKRKQAALPRCSVCHTRAVAQGPLKSMKRAKKNGMCVKCYYASGIPQERSLAERQQQIEERGACIRCGTHPIAAGKSGHSGKARECSMCLSCYMGQRREP